MKFAWNKSYLLIRSPFILNYRLDTIFVSLLQYFYYPVFDDLDAVRVNTTKDVRPVVMILFVIMYFELFSNILPENSNGVLVVLDNPHCSGGQTFTMQIDGSTARFVVSCQDERKLVFAVDVLTRSLLPSECW